MALASLLEKSVDNSKDFIELNDAVSDDSSLLRDEGWRDGMAEALAAFLRWGNEVRALVPPDAWLGVHTEMLSVAHHTDNFVLYYASGVDDFDLDMFDKANDEIWLATEAMDRALAEVDLLAGGL